MYIHDKLKTCRYVYLLDPRSAVTQQILEIGVQCLLLESRFGLNVDEEVFLRPLAMAGVLVLPGVPSLALPDVLGAISTENTNQ